MKYAHDTDGTAVESLDLSEEHDRLEREQRKLSRKAYESNNWEKQRQKVAECHLDIKRKRRDFLHKLSNYYAQYLTKFGTDTAPQPQMSAAASVSGR
jgi:putative transposase